ncbi:MAG: AAA family ATPase, partial [Candidatus Zixiibacteriota bacterium]
MKCPKCQTENLENKRFCRECGAELSKICPQCDCKGLPGDKFCGECGKKFEERGEIKGPFPAIGGERKQVTVLSSDLSGYTAISERLDPEEVKEIMSRIFGEIAQVVTKYEGFIERFIGDAVLALFGVPKAHEDDSVRAIKAAREIHDLVEAMSPQLEERVGRSLSMHTGINTGLVVTDEVILEKGTQGIIGDAINVASRLTGLARPGEILVGTETYRHAEGYFAFEGLEPTKVKGKTEPVQIYRVLSPREKPRRTHRLHGLRADLIGRKVEMAQLEKAIEQLREGKGTILSICGDAGTGKSRLVEEFKATLDLEEIQWREGHAYAYSQNIPYFPLIDLLNRALQIEEGDSPEKVREKIESGIERLIEKKEDILPYVGSLYALSYPEVEGVSPEFWKARLQAAMQAILAALTQKAPTVICLEDLHWTDPSFLDLLRFILSEVRCPAIFLCVYRPPFSLFTSHELSGMGKLYQEIRLQDLSPSEAQDMMESLLKTKIIPLELRRFIQEKVE